MTDDSSIRYGFWSCDGNSLHMDYYYFVYIYLCVWKLDLRLNNINFHQFLSFIICIDLNHYCHHYWTSELLLNLWEYTQGSDITNKWVIYFVISCFYCWIWSWSFWQTHPNLGSLLCLLSGQVSSVHISL